MPFLTGKALLLVASALGLAALSGGDSNASPVTPGGGTPPGGGGGTPPGGGGGGGGTPPGGDVPPGCVQVFPLIEEAEQAASGILCSVRVVYRGEPIFFVQHASAAIGRLAWADNTTPCVPIIGTNDARAWPTVLGSASWRVFGIRSWGATSEVWFDRTGSGDPELLIQAMVDASKCIPPTGPFVGPGGTEPTQPNDIDNVLATYDAMVRSDPTPGHLYAVRSGDSPLVVARRALGVGQGNARTAQYYKCMASSRWNWMLYSTKAQQGQMGVMPIVDDDTGQTVYGDISRAWLPVNENVRGALASGRLPKRLIQFVRGPNGETKFKEVPDAIMPRTWGVIWLPPTDRLPACYDWEDPDANPSELFAAMGLPLTAVEP
jgi:hypothetical protein